jgi:lincosamide nucleotidyltransferase
LLQADQRVVSALTYGSRPAGLGDRYSDVEFWVFVADAALASWSAEEWIGQVGEPLLVVRNEFGAHVAIFENLVRVELHFWPASDRAVVRSWPARGVPVEDMIVVDRDGGLAPELARLPLEPAIPDVAEVCGRFANWWALGWNVLRRGELERAYDALGHVRRHLLWMARLHESATDRWLTPSRLAEHDLSATAIAELARIAPRLTSAELAAAFRQAWELGLRWWPDQLPDFAPASFD